MHNGATIKVASTLRIYLLNKIIIYLFIELNLPPLRRRTYNNVRQMRLLLIADNLNYYIFLNWKELHKNLKFKYKNKYIIVQI
ncbi:hypothetical protein BpHYR1_009869 [Brachionus plicatilis]|uniref:Uncharacterized protein n=1 Tax=Brachionus plicatilis TaxID=10195 RepID=A0A3M7SEK9_BRAPC|nr:hypothetical protein BpHYR1_009869 [Brachionus plicatilis]